MAIKVTAPLSREEARKLKSGDSCLISGVIYTARDAAHKRLCELADKGLELPLDIKDSIIYYVGPTPPRKVRLSAAPVPPPPTVWMLTAPHLSGWVRPA